MNNTEQTKTEGPRKRRARRLGLVCFLLYVAALVYFLFFADWYDHTPGRNWEHRYNLLPFLEIRRFLRVWRQIGSRAALLNLLGNVVGFLPFGFFLPVITGKLRSFFKVTLLGACFSAFVELIQLLSRAGRCDIDDVILNTLGAALGYGLFLLCDEIRRKVQQRYGG